MTRLHVAIFIVALLFGFFFVRILLAAPVADVEGCRVELTGPLPKFPGEVACGFEAKPGVTHVVELRTKDGSALDFVMMKTCSVAGAEKSCAPRGESAGGSGLGKGVMRVRLPAMTALTRWKITWSQG